jgi:hypothetical protein
LGGSGGGVVAAGAPKPPNDVLPNSGGFVTSDGADSLIGSAGIDCPNEKGDATDVVLSTIGCDPTNCVGGKEGCKRAGVGAPCAAPNIDC